MTAILDFFNNIKTTAISIGISDIIEILILSFVAYKLIIWIKDTRAIFVVKGILLIVAFFVVANILELNTILYIAKGCLDILVIALLVIFQPELRGALEKLGKDSFFSKFLRRGRKKFIGAFSNESKKEIVAAVFDLARTKTGALIVIEKDIPLNEYIKSGIAMDAKISKQLLENIFEHNTPLHDGAVIISDDKIVAATCYLPLSNAEISKEFGTRHRAAVGVSEETDALTIIVSEETGAVSIAKNKKLIRDLNETLLKAELEAFAIDDDSTSKKIVEEAEDEKSNS